MHNTYRLRSRWVNGGRPTHCAYKGCCGPLQERAFHSDRDNRYYCDVDCADRELRRVARQAAEVH